jgi:Zn-dependent M28 family amino/carboxypeptidase
MRFFIKSFLLFQFVFSFSLVKAQSSLTDSLFHTDSLRHIVEVLASDSLKGRFTGTVENYKAAVFIAEEFKKAGLGTLAGNDGFFQEIKPFCFNVIGAIKGRSKPDQVIIFSAHYDHVGTTNTNPDPPVGNAFVEDGDVIYNGANDNASGVAAVISLAKYFKALGNNERTLLFVAFTGEELGLLGSKFLADNCEPDSIIAMVNIEMIGRSESNKVIPFVTGNYYSELLKILNRNYQAFTNKKGKSFFVGDPYPKEQLFERSDNYFFAMKGIPAHSIMLTEPTDKYYHSLNDEPETLEYDKMKKIIQAIAIGVGGLVAGTDTPKKIK